MKADGSLDRDAAGNEAVYIGTTLWSAPEVCEKASCQIVTDKADIFAYGLTIWEMLAKQTPHLPDISEMSNSSFDEEAYQDMLDELVGENFSLRYLRTFNNDEVQLLTVRI